MRFAVLTCVCLVGCQGASPPATTKPPSSEASSTAAGDRADHEATAEDRAVMSAVLDGVLRPERDRRIRAGHATLPDPTAPTGALFLVLDSTLPSCSPEALNLGDPILACFDVQRERRLLDELACDQDGTTTGAMLARRNGRSLAIRGRLGENVVLVSTDMVDRLPRLVELRERYPRGSAVVAFSAPIYPKAGVAALYYRAFNEGLGFVCLVHNENRWSVHTRKHLVE